MPSRTRTRLAYQNSGTAKVFVNGQLNSESSAGATFSDRCEDVIGDFGKDHRLRMNQWRIRKLDPYNGNTRSNAGDNTYVQYSGFVPSGFEAYTGHVTLPSIPSGLSTQVLSRTNPSRAYVDLPLFVYELRELPELIKFAGDTLLKKGASAYLSYQFGWKPLLSDLRKSLDFASQFNKRAKEIKRILEKGGVTYTVKLGRDNSIKSDRWVMSSLGADTIRADVMRFTSREVWGSVRWSPDPTRAPPTTDEAIMNLARRAVLGLTIDASTLWNAMPWSWLIDWYSNMGDFFEANRNIVPVQPGNVTIMSQTSTISNVTPASSYPFLTGGTMNLEYISKDRDVFSGATLNAGLTMLDARQTSILAALGITRLRGSGAFPGRR